METEHSAARGRYHGISSHSMSVFESPPGRAPSSRLHSASVHITGFAELVNPSPWMVDLPSRGRDRERGDGLSSDYLSPKKLIELTGERDLSKVTYLEFSINTMDNSLGNFGTHLPNLTQLRVVDSVVPCVRDLGTCLSSIEVLWLPRCKLKDLDGLPALSSLRELYLAFNEVTDISLITMLSSLELLDLESNNLSDLDQIGYLSLCPSLTTVNLDGNPICRLLAEKESGYRAAIHEAVPQLKILDDAPLTVEAEREESSLSSRSTLFSVSEAGVENDWRIVQQSIKQSSLSTSQLLEDEIPNAVSTNVTTTIGKISSKSLVRPQTAPSSGMRSPLPMDDSSELTHGLSQVICGNPARALKARRQHGLVSQSAVLLTSSLSGGTASGENILSQLQQWKLNTVQELPESNLSATLEEAGITVTRTSSITDLCEPDIQTQQPDRLSQSYSAQTPSPPKSFPPPSVRPHSVADFRHRRFRRRSTEPIRIQPTGAVTGGPAATSQMPNPLPPSNVHS